jgi:hypothetical protein
MMMMKTSKAKVVLLDETHLERKSKTPKAAALPSWKWCRKGLIGAAGYSIAAGTTIATASWRSGDDHF